MIDIQTVTGDLSAATISGSATVTGSLSGNLSVGQVSGSLSPSQTIGGTVGSTRTVSGGVNAPSDIGTVIPDETLTLPGRAADAKAVGDRLAIIEDKIDDLETEVGDASILLSLI